LKSAKAREGVTFPFTRYALLLPLERGGVSVGAEVRLRAVAIAVDGKEDGRAPACSGSSSSSSMPRRILFFPFFLTLLSGVKVEDDDDAAADRLGSNRRVGVEGSKACSSSSLVSLLERRLVKKRVVDVPRAEGRRVEDVAATAEEADVEGSSSLPLPLPF